jgi:hypothetical protein
MLGLPWIALLAVPFIRPWRVSRLFWTYLIPAIPLVLLVDGIVSCLRSYSEDELTALIRSLRPSPSAGTPTPYQWTVGWLPSPLSPIGVTYAVGYPLSEVGSGDRLPTEPRVARTT